MPSVAVAHEDLIWVTGSGQPGVRPGGALPRDAESLASWLRDLTALPEATARP
jgi:hypothetical protein